MPLPLIYPLYTFLLALLARMIVPIQEIKRLFIYALLFGASGDVIALLILKLFKIGGYINYGPLGFLGLPFFPMIAWTSFYLIYFWLFPKMKTLQFIYIAIAAAYSAFFSNVLLNLGVFQWNYGRVLLPFCIYLIWTFLSTYGFLKLDLE